MAKGDYKKTAIKFGLAAGALFGLYKFEEFLIKKGTSQNSVEILANSPAFHPVHGEDDPVPLECPRRQKPRYPTLEIQ